MGMQFEEALALVEEAAGLVFEGDRAVRSVGVSADANGVVYVAVRNSSLIMPLSAGGPPRVSAHQGVRIRYDDSVADPQSLMRVPHTGPAAPAVSSLVQEQGLHRPLVCGLQVQNFDDDLRTGQIAKGYITIGTLGCLVQIAGQGAGMLSNNHVLAAENRGKKGIDRILQPGASSFNASTQAGTLFDYVPLVPSPPGSSVQAGTAHLNEIDAATSLLEPKCVWRQTYLPIRPALPPKGSTAVTLGDKVHKVGRTTGLTYGVVTQVGVVVGPVAYSVGNCWFRRSFVVKGTDGAIFSDSGDSGSAIVRDSDGMVLGLLYAGNGTETYACPIGPVLSQLNCAIA